MMKFTRTLMGVNLVCFKANKLFRNSNHILDSTLTVRNFSQLFLINAVLVNSKCLIFCKTKTRVQVFFE